MPTLPLGKVPPEVLEKHVFPFLGVEDASILHGPGIGRDAALIRVGPQVVVVSTDPITGAIQNIGAYVVHICANDVATFGIRPRWFLATILLPEGSQAQQLEEIMESMHTTAKGLNVSIIGGHTEVTHELKRPIIIGFMLGLAEQDHYVTSTQALPGNAIILTKGVAIEGTAILATERATILQQKLGSSLVDRAQQFINRISVVPEALAAMSTGAVRAMHDPTEGGLSNGLHELANASGLGFIVDRSKIIIQEETQQICQVFNINPLDLIASGAMLMAVEEQQAYHILEALKKENIPATIIGRLVADTSQRLIIDFNGSIKQLIQPIEDALWEALQKSV